MKEQELLSLGAPAGSQFDPEHDPFAEARRDKMHDKYPAESLEKSLTESAYADSRAVALLAQQVVAAFSRALGQITSDTERVSPDAGEALYTAKTKINRMYDIVDKWPKK